jgi:hypothetical protein
MSDKNTKHNWFELKGDIRVKETMTTKEFSELLDKLGLDFTGSIHYSPTKDEDYN